jgi:hypothetical protein
VTDLWFRLLVVFSQILVIQVMIVRIAKLKILMGVKMKLFGEMKLFGGGFPLRRFWRAM